MAALNENASLVKPQCVRVEVQSETEQSVFVKQYVWAMIDMKRGSDCRTMIEKDHAAVLCGICIETA